jgi:hypothetical protein
VKSFRETAAGGTTTNISAWLERLEDGASRPGLRFTAYREPKSASGSDHGDDSGEHVVEDDVDAASVQGQESPLDDANPIAFLKDMHVSHQLSSIGSNPETAVEDTETVVSAVSRACYA